MAEEYERAGYIKVALDGTTVPDDAPMKARGFEIISSAIVKSKTDRAKKALTNGELYAQIFPDGPGAKPDAANDLDEVDSQVRLLLMRKVWGITGPGPRGFVQKRLGDTSLILCRGSVLRTMDNVMAVYVTDEPTLIMQESLAPQIDKLVRLASDVNSHASMIVTRHPELESRVTAALNSGFNRVKAAAQITAGSSNGRKPVETEQE
jgi:hypothetical protein